MAPAKPKATIKIKLNTKPKTRKKSKSKKKTKTKAKPADGPPEPTPIPSPASQPEEAEHRAPTPPASSTPSGPPPPVSAPPSAPSYDTELQSNPKGPQPQATKPAGTPSTTTTTTTTLGCGTAHGFRFPLEVYNRVILNFHYTKKSKLIPLMLINHFFQKKIQQKLYHTIRDLKPSQHKLFHEAIAASPDLGALVKNYNFTYVEATPKTNIKKSTRSRKGAKPAGGCDDSQNKDEFGVYFWSAVKTGLSKLTNLQTLAITLQGASAPSQVSARVLTTQLKALTFPSLRTFTWSLSHSESALSNFFSRHPHIHTLRVTWKPSCPLPPHVLPNLHTLDISDNALLIFLRGRQVRRLRWREFTGKELPKEIRPSLNKLEVLGVEQTNVNALTVPIAKHLKQVKHLIMLGVPIPQLRRLELVPAFGSVALHTKKSWTLDSFYLGRFLSQVIEISLGEISNLSPLALGPSLVEIVMRSRLLSQRRTFSTIHLRKQFFGGIT
ncbi:hypothetical protein BDN72DRAFT_860310 [Pluteus cervinus]|uniref:Uncharacterized protein n=1 Tax=Pluteus cervinus TaxID=181527 RepID=A0ACD3AJU4_9AGAR|nr:hypothetical protein BDN72DRAFT_860310 [Pluteus cervinus]